MTGQPKVIASNGGSPKPSAKEGNARQKESIKQRREFIVRQPAEPNNVICCGTGLTGVEYTRIAYASDRDLQSSGRQFVSQAEHEPNVLVRGEAPDEDHRIGTGRGSRLLRVPWPPSQRVLVAVGDNCDLVGRSRCHS